MFFNIPTNRLFYPFISDDEKLNIKMKGVDCQIFNIFQVALTVLIELG